MAATIDAYMVQFEVYRVPVLHTELTLRAHTPRTRIPVCVVNIEQKEENECRNFYLFFSFHFGFLHIEFFPKTPRSQPSNVYLSKRKETKKTYLIRKYFLK